MFFCFVTKHACDRRTNRQTDRRRDGWTNGQNYDSRGKNFRSGVVKAHLELEINIFVIISYREFHFFTELRHPTVKISRKATLIYTSCPEISGTFLAEGCNCIASSAINIRCLYVCLSSFVVVVVCDASVLRQNS